MTTIAGPITFVIAGTDEAASAALRGAAAPRLAGSELRNGRIKHAVRPSARRGTAETVRVTATPGVDVVVLQIDGGPALVLHPENARDLLLAQQGKPRVERGAAPGDIVPGEVEVPAALHWQGLEAAASSAAVARGVLGEVAIAAFKVVTGVSADAAADIVASGIVKRFDEQASPGVYLLTPGALPQGKADGKRLDTIPAADGALLVLVHGTFSSIEGTFEPLWTGHPEHVRALFDRYAGRVYGFQHPTLGVSPIDNALTLARALPQGARVHLLTHSRGGLVAEVLARVCAERTADGAALEAFDAPHASQREALQALAALAAERDLRVARVVRVACPARGTLLASKRLDAYLSVFKWTLELAKVPVAPELVDFLGEVAVRRADPTRIPGLEAQIPGSALIRWLHAVEEPIEGELRVVAGDIQGDSITSWVKTLLADAFYWTDNDLVVQTRSMYGGAPRRDGAVFLYDRGGTVSHFNYFTNERTAAAITLALTQSAPPPGFRAIGPLSWAGESPTGVRGAVEAADSGEKPAVFVLPGILGSNLKVADKRIWLGWRILNGLPRLQYKEGTPDEVQPDGAIEHVYDDLESVLAATHHVVEFAYDWRKPLEAEARRLADRITQARDAREGSAKPVRIVAHSMGGLLARTLQLECPEVWDRMMARPGARLLMLGTPNGGSWAPMQVLSGDDTFGNVLVAFGAPFQDHKARDLMAQFPGFLQLQAGLRDERLKLGRAEEWARLAAEDLARVREYNWWHSDELQLVPYQWGVPAQDVLDAAARLRERLDAQRDRDLARYQDRLALVVGRAAYTPDGYEETAQGFDYLNAVDGGDGRVTLASARMPGVATWKLDCEHGALPSRREAFAAYVQLLDTGDTQLLDRVAEGVRSESHAAPAPAHVRGRPSRAGIGTQPPEEKRDVLETASAEVHAPSPAAAPLRVTLIHGDLVFVRHPLLLGHYRTMRLTGTEKVMDALVGGVMSARLSVNSYPDAPGENQVFVNTTVSADNPWQLPRPEGVIVVGLGEEGALAASAREDTVVGGVLAGAQRVLERGPAAPPSFEIASTLIGSGGIGVAVSDSAQALLRAVYEANRRLARLRWPVVSRLYVIEVYRNRAAEAWHALQIEAAARPGRYAVSEPARTGIGGLSRPLEADYRGAPYDFVRISTRERDSGDADIEYTLDTKRARTELRAQATQARLVRSLIRTASNGAPNPQLGATLFQLLVPLELEAFLAGATELQLELDYGTAGIPWELLDVGEAGAQPDDARPWAIRAKLLRKLRTKQFRERIADSGVDASVLVIGEPKCGEAYPRLAGARAEARAVAAKACAALPAERVVALISGDEANGERPDALALLNALYDKTRRWRIVHIAGHGDPPESIAPKDARAGRIPDPHGVVLSEGYLGPREIKSMRFVPELVFVNCCFLATADPGDLLAEGAAAGYDRAAFAAGVAQALIEIGVKCVIAAGWAVNDAAAQRFAETFYDALLAQRRRFIDAVGLAREAAWQSDDSTWAAYQCYGDPEWIFRPEIGRLERAGKPPEEEFGAIATHADLVLTLDTLAVQSRFQNAPADAQRAKIRFLEARYGPLWGARGDVAAALGHAWMQAGNADAAIRAYERAMAANDGTAPMRAGEQLANTRVRRAADTVEALRERRDALALQLAHEEQPETKAQLDAQRKAADEALAAAIPAARESIDAAVRWLDHFAALEPSMERESLLGSAYKRLAVIAALTEDPCDEVAAVGGMLEHYGKAEVLGAKSDVANAFYPGQNVIAAQLALHAGERAWSGLDPGLAARVRERLRTKAEEDPDFWSVVGLVELGMQEAVAAGTLAQAASGLQAEFRHVHARASASRDWRSVYDTARLVLAPYAKRAGEAEAEAAGALLDALKTLAGTA
jgi:hypothetical protein